MLNNAAVFLQELGRPIEALEPMQLGLEMRVQQENWKQAAINTINLSHLDLTLGEVGEAVRDAEQSVIYAERSGDAEEGVITRTTYADALHQAGRWVEAETRFSEAEAIIAKSLPGQLFLFSVSGFRYCDLLLTAPERAAWQTMQKSEPRSQRSTLIEGCHTVSQRAAQTLKLAEQYSYDILSIALDHLTLGRAALCVEILEDSDLRRSISDIEHIDTSVDGLRRSGSVNDLPRGLLTRAWMRFLTGARTGPESAQRDLDEAWEIAERGPMPLHMADIHLHRARLFFREANYPWESPQKDLAEARRLIEKHSYLRRMEELEDAERVILGKPAR